MEVGAPAACPAAAADQRAPVCLTVVGRAIVHAFLFPRCFFSPSPVVAAVTRCSSSVERVYDKERERERGDQEAASMLPIRVVDDGTIVHKPPPRYASAFAVRTVAQPTGVGQGLALNPDYFTTTAGIIKLIQVVSLSLSLSLSLALPFLASCHSCLTHFAPKTQALAIACMVCMGTPLAWFARLLIGTAAISFAITLLMCIAYFISLKHALYCPCNVPWTAMVRSNNSCCPVEAGSHVNSITGTDVHHCDSRCVPHDQRHSPDLDEQG